MATARQVNADFGYKPRAWQSQFHRGSANKRFAQCIAGRQQGKTELSLAELVSHALADNGKHCFAYVCPYVSQARKVFWPRLKKFLNPVYQYCYFRENDMQCVLPNGSTIYCLGADNDAARGLSLKGIVVDEFDGINTDTWTSVYLPAQASFGDEAWVIYIGTIGFGHSKLYEQHEERKDDPDWYCQITNAVEAGVLNEKQLERLRLEMGNSNFLREMMCDPHAPSERSVLGSLLVEARMEGRVTALPINPVRRMVCAFDLGIRDATSVWLVQLNGLFVDVLYYREYHGMGLDRVIAQLQTEFANVQWGEMVVPGDANNREGRDASTRLDLFYEMDFGEPYNVKKPDIADTLAATRINMSRMRFNEVGCMDGLNHLMQAEYVVDARTNTTLNKISHDDASHCLDAFRYLCFWLERENPVGGGTPFGKGSNRAGRVLRSV